MSRIEITKDYYSGGRQEWYKIVNSIDESKSNGYAFDGKFLNEGEHDVDTGSIIVCCYPTGSVKNGSKAGIAWVVDSDGKLITKVECDNWFTHFLSFRDEVASLLTNEKPNPLEKYSDEEVKAEFQRRNLSE